MVFSRRLLIIGFLFSTRLFADCTSPAGVAGRLEFISNAYKYCNGTEWVDMTGTTGAACSDLGKMTIVGGALSYCNGSNWISMVGINLGAVCTELGKLEYSFSDSVMNVCNGTNWTYFEAGGGGSTTGGTTGGGGGGSPPPTFDGHTFTTCGATGAQGPTLSDCQGAYAGTAVYDDLDMNTQGVQEWTVPEDGDYYIVAAGAGATYGNGMVMGGKFTLTAGEVLKLVVGQKGEYYSSLGSGGGGGSFVWIDRPGSPLIVAGGGGGGRQSTNLNAVPTNNANSASHCAASGTSGNGGGAVSASYAGGGGAGWLGNGANGNDSGTTIPGGLTSSFIGGVPPASNFKGGFGGGGAGAYPWGGGGGGGYSGGGGGNSSNNGGCGGGSYNAGTSQSNGQLNSGEGYIRILPFDASADCLPVAGSTCTGGSVYAGRFFGADYMVTPSGCTNSSTPTCAGGTDTLKLTWRGSSGSNQDIPGITNISGSADSSAYTQLGDTLTPVITAHSSVSSNSAADYCQNLDYGGYQDWFLPSKTELLAMFCDSNGTLSSPSVYPQESTGCTLFGGKKAALLGFAPANYWTSSENSSSSVWYQSFSNGSQSTSNKSTSNNIRCIRRGNTAPTPTPPIGLSLSHANQSINFTVSWTGAGENAEDCVLQNYDGSRWRFANNIPCNGTASNLNVSLETVGNNWNGRQVRIAAFNGLLPLATFPQTLNCTTSPASLTSTPTIDENCNGYWDEVEYPMGIVNASTKTFGANFTCPATLTQYDPSVQHTVDYSFSYVDFYTYNLVGTRYTDETCATVDTLTASIYVENPFSYSSGVVPNTSDDDPAFNMEITSCQPDPYYGNPYGFIMSSVPTEWEYGECKYFTNDAYYN